MTKRPMIRRGLFDRFSSERQEINELQADTKKSGCNLISSQQNRNFVTIHGVIHSITILPIGGAPSMEAELYDGSGTVILIWLGRRKITGISSGRNLKVSGRLGVRNGKSVIYNPRYELDA